MSKFSSYDSSGSGWGLTWFQKHFSAITLEGSSVCSPKSCPSSYSTNIQQTCLEFMLYDTHRAAQRTPMNQTYVPRPLSWWSLQSSRRTRLGAVIGTLKTEHRLWWRMRVLQTGGHLWGEPGHRETREEATGQSERAWGEISKAGWLAACANN